MDAQDKDTLPPLPRRRPLREPIAGAPEAERLSPEELERARLVLEVLERQE